MRVHVSLHEARSGSLFADAQPFASELIEGVTDTANTAWSLSVPAVSAGGGQTVARVTADEPGFMAISKAATPDANAAPRMILMADAPVEVLLHPGDNLGFREFENVTSTNQWGV